MLRLLPGTTTFVLFCHVYGLLEAILDVMIVFICIHFSKKKSKFKQIETYFNYYYYHIDFQIRCVLKTKYKFMTKSW